jgi:hypothetical protein
VKSARGPSEATEQREEVDAWIETALAAENRPM